VCQWLATHADAVEEYVRVGLYTDPSIVKQSAKGPCEHAMLLNHLFFFFYGTKMCFFLGKNGSSF
jgi:hypothetical protein